MAAKAASKRTKRSKSGEAPWKEDNPKPKSARKPLSPAQKTDAKKRATKAGRPYPNLVDNMAVAKKKK